MDPHADVLLVTTAQLESKAVLEGFEGATGNRPKQVAAGGRLCFDLGKIAGASVFLVQVDIEGEPQKSIVDGARKIFSALTPSAVILTGLGCGISPEEQPLGDILVSQHVDQYDVVLVDFTNSERSRKITIEANEFHFPVTNRRRLSAATWLVDCFRSADLIRPKSKWKVQFGTILMEEEELNSFGVETKFLNTTTDLIGADTQNMALMDAFGKAKVDWIIVKGVTGWFGQLKPTISEARKRTAVKNTAKFIVSALQQAPNWLDVENPEEAAETPQISIPNPKVIEPKEVPCRTVLFLAADPTDEARLRIGEEMREIQEKLKLSKLRDRFLLEAHLSVRPNDVSQAMLDLQPQIVHFAGHGALGGEIYFEDSRGKARPVSPQALADLFEQFTACVECVVLSACYSEAQAKAIARHIPWVIGMNQAIEDPSGVAFAIGFYQALGAGRSYEEAFKLGKVQIGLQGHPDAVVPVLCNRV